MQLCILDLLLIAGGLWASEPELSAQKQGDPAPSRWDQRRPCSHQSGIRGGSPHQGVARGDPTSARWTQEPTPEGCPRTLHVCHSMCTLHVQ